MTIRPVTRLLLGLLAGAVLAGAASAENLYRCISPQGQSTYQQSPQCPAGQRLAGEIAYWPEPDSKPVARPAKPALMQRAASTGRIAATGGKREPTASERCRAAREERERTAEKLGLKRTYADLDRLDAPVRAACRW